MADGVCSSDFVRELVLSNEGLWDFEWENDPLLWVRVGSSDFDPESDDDIVVDVDVDPDEVLDIVGFILSEWLPERDLLFDCS